MRVKNTEPKVFVHHVGGGKTQWVVESNWFAQWEHEGRIYRTLIPNGFSSDKASIPRPLWILAAPDELGLKAVILHDWGHFTKGLMEIQKHEKLNKWKHLGKVQFTRKQFDSLFFRFLREDCVEPRWRRRGAYKAVRAWSKLNGDSWA